MTSKDPTRKNQINDILGKISYQLGELDDLKDKLQNENPGLAQYAENELTYTLTEGREQERHGRKQEKKKASQ